MKTWENKYSLVYKIKVSKIKYCKKSSKHKVLFNWKLKKNFLVVNLRIKYAKYNLKYK